ncbi:MAG: hypothetical protein QOE70_136 [Chthoniobacter sp.]|nr:hypothetical protein [Chthoniobacter sp.]
MKVLHLTANQFIRPMSNGRNRPLLLGCEDAAGKQFEIVVKLRGREMSVSMQLAELVTAQFADDLGLDVPQAAVVELPLGFEAVMPQPEAAAAAQASPGLNFGSLHLGTGFTTWPPGRAPHGHQRDQAAAIFAFDALVQNPDRKAANPNLWARSDRLGVYDHEQAFSFLSIPIIGGAPRPWEVDDHVAASFRFLESHIFYAALRGAAFSLDEFEERLGSLTDNQLEGYGQSVPEDWRADNDLCEKIADYLREARQERSKFLNFIRYLLR